MLRRNANEIAALKRELQRLRPMKSAGVLTSHTTRGVSRVADPSTMGRRKRGGGPARWS